MGAHVSLDDLVRQNFVYDPASGIIFWRRTFYGRQAGTRADYLRASGYRAVSANKAHLRAHRVAVFLMTGSWPLTGLVVDHINQDKQDNRWGNLRVVSKATNRINSFKRFRKEHPFAYKQNPKGRRPWCGKITLGNEPCIVGWFETEMEAHEAVTAYLRERHPERVPSFS